MEELLAVLKQMDWQVIVNYTKFLGYDKGPDRIARELEEEGILNWNFKAKLYESNLRKMLSNEKYKGDALL